jgi:assimilatory nitrate reductase catalytic subunit
MERRLLKDGDLVHVTSRRGSQLLPAVGGDDMRSGQAFVAMHWGEEYVSGRGREGSGSHGVNALTLPAIDPYSFQPELKHAAVKILKAELPWRFVVLGWIPASEVLILQKAMRPYMKRFAYASCTLFGRDRAGLLFRAADDYPAEPALLQQIEALFGLGGNDVLRYDDRRRGNSRRILVRENRLEAVALAGDIAAEAWIKEYLQSGQSVATLGRMLLMPSPVPPKGYVARGKIVCNCFNVGEATINACLEELPPGGPADALAGLQQRLKCGTNCGSCVPELKQMISAARVVPVAAN